MPDGGSASTSSRLARATPSIPPTRSVWAPATDVTTPIVGAATPQSRAISPKPRMPISTTSTSTSSGAPRIVTGSPCSLLKLRSLAVTRRVAPSAAATRSFVLVLPTLPVMPTTGTSSCRRAHAASSINAVAVFVDDDRRAALRRACGEVGGGAGDARGVDEIVPVALGDERHEQLAGPQRARVERRPVDGRVGPDEGAADGRRNLRCQQPHAPERYRHISERAERA